MKINHGENWDNVQLTYDNVIIKVKKKVEEKEEGYTATEGGLLIPKESKKTKKEIYGVGEVMVAGFGYHSTDGKGIVPLSVKKGDFVVINISDPTNGNIVHEDDEHEYRLIREQNVLMKSETEDTFIIE